MLIEPAVVTDVTRVTRFPYPPYTCTRARQNTYRKKVTRVTSVTRLGGLLRRVGAL